MPEEPKQSFVGGIIESFANTIHGLITGEAEGDFLKSVKKWISLEAWVDWFGEWGISRAFFVTVIFVSLFIAAQVLLPRFFTLVWGWIFLGIPVIGPIGLTIAFAGAWMWYVNSYFIFSRTDPILLDVKMPAEVTKSPRAMEIVLTNLWIRMSTTTFIDRNWSGGVLPTFSLEIVSLGGEVHFCIWTKRILKNTVESNLYAQYPEIEIVEIEDYATKFQYDPKKHQCFVSGYRAESNAGIKPDDPAINAYPMKTYIDYELDKDPKEEFKIEPMAQVLEVFGTMNKDEQAWLQIVIRGHFSKEWKETVENEVEKIRRESTQLRPNGHEDEDAVGFPRPTWRQTEQIRTMERNLGKLPFDFGIRSIYIGPRGKMRSPEYGALRWIFRPYANQNYMTYIRPRFGHNIYDYPWQDWRDIRYELFTYRFLDAYRRRLFFQPPWVTPYNITTPEVLATIWHPPSRTVKTPGLQRIPSAKSEPPANLPM